MLAQEVECNIQLAAADPIVYTQEQLELRKVLRNKIQTSYTVFSANVNALVNTDREGAMVKLNEIHELIERLQKFVPTKELQINVRPELSRPGGKPKLTKAKLFTRAEQRKKRDADKGGASQR
ncbi:unnamed protein product [Haemonchus placei]|uniref:RF_PROK_I domain-containing protein n=1 Tax=Haemonchus placei TaxID=6290 RepID=A0A0N4VUA4_HAEPC|nr:unnamed protein product [Haemonchus placei]